MKVYLIGHPVPMPTLQRTLLISQADVCAFYFPYAQDQQVKLHDGTPWRVKNVLYGGAVIELEQEQPS